MTRGRNQTKRLSAIETMVSTAVGFLISLLLVNLILPLFGFYPTPRDSVSITLLFTLASLVRGYLIRRLFNYLNNRWMR